MSTSTSTPAATSDASSPSRMQGALNILSIGGSRHIGYYASLKLLQKGATVTFLLRNPSVFDNDASIQPFISSGKAHIVKGDALIKEDVAKAWNGAISMNSEGRVDYLLFTLGGSPKFSLTKGITLNPPNLVTIALLNTLSTLPLSLLSPSPSSNANAIRIITISSTGLTPTSHASLPLPLKPMYNYLLTNPHFDKIGAERLLHHVTDTWEWDTKRDGNVKEGILPEGWERTEGLMKQNELRHVVVLRPSLFTDGESLGEKYDEAERKAKETKGKERKKDKAPYRVETEREIGGYTISRKDVAHFIVDLVLNRWAEYENKIVNISY